MVVEIYESSKAYHMFSLDLFRKMNHVAWFDCFNFLSNINKGNVTLVLMDAQTSIIRVFHVVDAFQMKGNISNIDTFSQIWLNVLMDDCHFSYITKLKKECKKIVVYIYIFFYFHI
jgi:hypothetical protein